MIDGSTISTKSSPREPLNENFSRYFQKNSFRYLLCPYIRNEFLQCFRLIGCSWKTVEDEVSFLILTNNLFH